MKLRLSGNLLMGGALLTQSASNFTMSGVPEKPFPRDVGAVLRARRMQAKLSQKQLAIKAGFGPRPSTISDLENGQNVHLETLVKVAQALGYETLTAAVLNAGGDPETRALLRLWHALPGPKARTDVLDAIQRLILRGEEDPAT
jgi:transcriptional regulator with XRE-family HTH domain